MLGTTAERLELLQAMIGCRHHMYFWTYTPELQLCATNCPYPNELQVFFLMELNDYSPNIWKNAPVTYPMIFHNSLGLTWICDFEKDEAGQPLQAYVMGPVFYEKISDNGMEQALNRLRLSAPVRKAFQELLYELPILQIDRFMEFGLMMHYCITGEQLSFSDYRYASAEKMEQWEAAAMEMPGKTATEGIPERTTPADYSWIMEQRLQQMMEQGDMEYKAFSSKMVELLNPSFLMGSNSIRMIKNTTIIHTALCMRSAIRGGLSLEIAYTLSDQYINSIEGCTSLLDVMDVNSAMVDDFLQRVHQCHARSDVSPQIMKCCNYIQLHFNEKLQMRTLAQYVNYSETHLAKKFKAEVGMPIKQYILNCRMSQAKQLIAYTNMSIQDICEEVGFASTSYFGELFRQETGMTPMEYRCNGGESS